MSRPSCKGMILDAAESVVRDGGAAHLTLDAVADRAGVSKGGLLYHFPNKEAMIEGMIDRVIERGTRRREAAVEQLPETPSRELKADIISLLVSRGTDDRVSTALLAAVANEPKLMSTFRELHRQRFAAHAQNASQPERIEIILLAAYGLFFLELLQGSPFGVKQRQALVTEMLHFADDVVQHRDTI